MAWFAVADLQQSELFNQPLSISPCPHTIRNQDLMVPFEGCEGWADGTPQCREAVSGERQPLFSRTKRPGVSGDGVAARPVPKRYGCFKQTQLAFGIQPDRAARPWQLRYGEPQASAAFIARNRIVRLLKLLKQLGLLS